MQNISARCLRTLSVGLAIAATVAVDSPSASAASTLPECTAGSLQLSFGDSAGGMSQLHQVLRFTNAGAATCLMQGFPGLSFVAGDDGHQVGNAAYWAGARRGPVTLTSGQVASTVIDSVNPGAYDPGVCQPVDVTGYRVYAPDDTDAMFIPLPDGTQACSANVSGELGVYPIVAGPGDPRQP
jgi:hypothetical protein